MSGMFSRGRRKVAAVIAIALVASLSQVGATNAASPSAPKRGGSLKVGIFDTFVGWCMADNNANSSLFGMRTIYEGFFEMREDGKVVPWLVKDVAHSADYKTWSFTLRDGVTFHTGEKLDAAALALNFEALRGSLYVNGLLGRKPSTPSPATAAAFTANINKVTVTGPLSVQVDLYKAQTDFPETMYASGRFVARAPSQLTGGKCSSEAVGTGPFKVSSWNPSELVVVKNDAYWRKDAAGGKLPYLDKITFTFLVETKPREQGVKNGSLDMAMFSSASESKQMGALLKNKNLTSLLQGPDHYPWIWFNQRVAPFNNVDARLAFAYAMNREQFVKVRQKGIPAVVPDSIVGPNNVMYNKAGFTKFDLAKAKEHAAKYKAATGKDIAAVFPYTAGSTESLANATLIKQYAEAAGIQLTLLPQTTAEIISKFFPFQYQVGSLTLAEGLGSGFTAPFLFTDASHGNPANPLTAASKLAPALAQLAIVPRILNINWSTDTTLDQILIDARATPIASQKKALYKQATQRIQELAYATPVAFTRYMLTYGKKVQGVNELKLLSGGNRRPVTNFGIDLTGVWLDK